jgi:hypothetical protein
MVELKISILGIWWRPQTLPFRLKNMRFAGLSVRSQSSAPYGVVLTIFYLEWPHSSDMRMDALFRTKLSGLTEGEGAKSLLLEFEDTQIPELTRALEAPICEFVCRAFSTTLSLSLN